MNTKETVEENTKGQEVNDDAVNSVKENENKDIKASSNKTMPYDVVYCPRNIKI